MDEGIRRIDGLGTARQRRAAGRSVAEGWRLVERALAAGVTPELVLVSERATAGPTPDEARVLAALAAQGVATCVAPDTAVQARTGGRSFGDLLAVVPMADRGLAGLLAGPAPLLVGVHVLDPGNIGALWRTAHALGAGGVIWIGGTDPTHPKALRSAMGSCFRLPWTRGDAEPTLRALLEAGRPLVATVARDGAALGEAALPERAALLLGGEAHGLPPALITRATHRLHIPMAAGCDSLSINAAAAVALHALPGRRVVSQR